MKNRRDFERQLSIHRIGIPLSQDSIEYIYHEFLKTPKKADECLFFDEHFLGEEYQRGMRERKSASDTPEVEKKLYALRNEFYALLAEGQVEEKYFSHQLHATETFIALDEIYALFMDFADGYFQNKAAIVKRIGRLAGSLKADVIDWIASYDVMLFISEGEDVRPYRAEKAALDDDLRALRSSIEEKSFTAPQLETRRQMVLLCHYDGIPLTPNNANELIEKYCRNDKPLGKRAVEVLFRNGDPEKVKDENVRRGWRFLERDIIAVFPHLKTIQGRGEALADLKKIGSSRYEELKKENYL